MNSKRKGSRIEYEIRDRHISAGIEARRVPFSGSIGTLRPELTSMRGDVQILDGEFIAEVKARKSGTGFKTIEGWLGDNDMLFLRRDRQPPLVVLPWKVYVRLMKSFASKPSTSHTPQR